MKGLELLHPEARAAADKLVSACAAKRLGIAITDTLRTTAEQDALYAQGRTAPGNIVTSARGSEFRSLHQWGVAFDFCRKEQGRAAFDNSDGFFDKVGAVGKALGGLSWGGDWKSPDRPHFQLSRFSPDGTANKMKADYKEPVSFIRTWQGKDGEAALKALGAVVNNVGAGLAPPVNTPITATLTTARVEIDGAIKNVASVFYKDENYIRIRDIMPLVGFTVDYDAGTKTIVLTR